MPMLSWLSRARVEDWQDWHKLCVILVDYAHPTAEVSYLSSKKVRLLQGGGPGTADEEGGAGLAKAR